MFEHGAAVPPDSTAAPDPTDLDAIRVLLQEQDPTGRLHPIGMRAIRIGENALAELPALVLHLARPGPVIVIGDPTPIRRGGDDLKVLVADLLAVGHEARRATIGAGRAELHADEAALVEAAAAIAGAGCVVSVGSGTMTDIAKAATHRAHDLPLIVVQTAVSVNAFSDVHVEERSIVQASVVLPHVSVGRNCVIHKAILDEGCVVPDGTRIGIDAEADRRRFEVTERGVVLVTPDMLRTPG